MRLEGWTIMEYLNIATLTQINDQFIWEHGDTKFSVNLQDLSVRLKSCDPPEIIVYGIYQFVVTGNGYISVGTLPSLDLPVFPLGDTQPRNHWSIAVIDAVLLVQQSEGREVSHDIIS